MACSSGRGVLLHQQRGDAAGAAAHREHAGAGLAAGAHIGYLDACGREPRPRRIGITTRQLMPYSLSCAGFDGGSRALHGFDNQIAAAEEHQPAPVRMRTVQRHVEPEPRAVKGRGALGIAGRDDHVIHAVIGASAVAAERGRSLASSRKNSRTPRVASVAARVRFHDSVAPERIAAFGLGNRFRLQRQAGPAGDASARYRLCESRCWPAPRPAPRVQRESGPRPRHRRAGDINSSVMLSRVNSTVSAPSPAAPRRRARQQRFVGRDARLQSRTRTTT